MKRTIALLLSLLLLLSGAAYAEMASEEFVPLKSGIVDEESGIELEKVINAHNGEKHPEIENIANHIYYPNLSAALLALGRGDIGVLTTFQSCCDYVLSRADQYIGVAPPPFIDDEGEASVPQAMFSMMTLDTGAELHKLLDNAIKQLKADGTLDNLIENQLKTYISTDPVPAELPKFEGAPTYRIAVTGDLPPMDFATADGKAAGFNVALLTEIANIAQVNFELVTVESGAKTLALASGRADAAFWMLAYSCNICGELLTAKPESALLTEAYFADGIAYLLLKPAQ